MCRWLQRPHCPRRARCPRFPNRANRLGPVQRYLRTGILWYGPATPHSVANRSHENRWTPGDRLCSLPVSPGAARNSRGSGADGVSQSGPCTRRRRWVPGVRVGRWLRPGFPTARERYRLRLLPPGSDLVRERSPRGTWPSTPSTGVLAPRPNPSDGDSAPLERIAGAGHRYLPA